MYLQFLDSENFNQYDSLPVKIRLADGSTRTSLHELAVEQRESLGLYEYQDVTPAYNNFSHLPNGQLSFDHVARTFIREVSIRDQSAIKQDLVNAIQRYLDTEAQAHFYDGILSLCSYATSTNPKFGPEGQAGVAWRDACWATGYAIMAEVEAQTRSIPTVDELLAEMPTMEWPT